MLTILNKGLLEPIIYKQERAEIANAHKLISNGLIDKKQLNKAS